MSCHAETAGRAQLSHCIGHEGSYMTAFFVLTVYNRKWRSKGGKGGTGGYQGPIEGLPELIAACDGREEIFRAMVKEEFEPQQITQVTHT